MKIYTSILKVQEHHLDYNNHVNNIEFLRWAQRISGEHWSNVATEQMQQDYQWVVSRNEIDYFKQVFLGDELELTTWIESSEKATSIRIIEIQNLTRNELAAKAKIFWYALDPNSGRPKRIAEDVKERFG